MALRSRSPIVVGDDQVLGVGGEPAQARRVQRGLHGVAHLGVVLDAESAHPAGLGDLGELDRAQVAGELH